MAGRTTVRRWAIALGAVGLIGSGALVPTAASALEPAADLSVTVAHAPDSATAPAAVTFTVTASNAGPDAAEDVVIGLGYRYPLEVEAASLPDGCYRSPSYESVVCEVGDVPASGSASVDIVLQARGSGLFSLPAAVTSATADPDAGDRVATDTLLVKAGPSQAVRYIRGIFPMIMNRNPDTATTNYWAGKWKTANVTYPRVLQRVPLGIMNSDEYRRIRVREMFTRILGRTPDPSGLAHWVGKARAGMPYATIEQKLIGSTEFASHAQPELDAIFQAVLGRGPTNNEVLQWQHVAAGTGAERAYMAASLQRSTEGFDVIIKQRYQTTLGEAPTALARYIWQVKLRQGVSPEQLWADLLTSYEVLQDYPYTVDDYEEGYDVTVPASDVLAAVEAA